MRPEAEAPTRIVLEELAGVRRDDTKGDIHTWFSTPVEKAHAPARPSMIHDIVNFRTFVGRRPRVVDVVAAQLRS